MKGSGSRLLASHGNLNILYYNARSLLPKLSELQLVAKTYSPSIICVTESWLNHEITDNELSIPGYHLVRLDRSRNGGGVVFYVSANLNFSVLPKCDGLELLSIVISNGSCKVCISLFYRPPSSSPLILDSLCTYIESLNIHQYSNYILLGDFNVNFFSHDNSILFCKLKSLSNLFSVQQIVTEPTHIHHNGSASLIDLIFVSNNVLTNFCNVIPP